MSKKEFKAESKRRLDMMINSIYTHKEIFLREIISHASDAIDQLCYLSLTDDKVGLKREDFQITLTIAQETRTLTVSDNGIGMDESDLENNLGVIANSGSLQFKGCLLYTSSARETLRLSGRAWGVHGLFEDEFRARNIHAIWMPHALPDKRNVSRAEIRTIINDYMTTVMHEEPLDPSLLEFDDSQSW